MEKSPQRKPKLYFDTALHPLHVTFDDGKAHRRNLPWHDFVEARWDYDEPDAIMMEIGSGVVVIRGHNLAPLFSAIEDQTLSRVRAHPDVARDHEREFDTFVVEIRFVKAAPQIRGPVSGGQTDLNLGD